jgi:hypothetical protein
MSDDERVIVCAGMELYVVADRFEDGQGIWRFVMSDWLGQGQFRTASLLWIVDDSAPWDQVYSALSYCVPLLVPESNRAMNALCITAGCGLYYNTSESGYLLSLLLTDSGLRKRLGESGYAYVQRAGLLGLSSDDGVILRPV